MKKLALVSGMTAAVISMALVTTPVTAGQTSKKKAAKAPADQFQLTLSTVPYSKDPNSAFVRNHCAPDKKTTKPTS